MTIQQKNLEDITVSLVILNWNNKKLLKACLETLHKYQPKVKLQTIVVDNASEDGSQEMMKKDFPSIMLLENKENLGYAAGNNVGIKKATGDYTFLLNEDIEFTSNIIDQLVTYLEEHPEVGAISPRLQYRDGSTQYSCRAFPTIGRLYKQIIADLKLVPHNKFWTDYKMNYWEHDDTREVDQPMTTALLVHNDLLQKLEGFDADFKNYFNDVDLAYRIKVQEGKKIVFTGDTGFIIHYHGQGMKKLKWGRITNWNDGLRRFYKKHYVSSSFNIKYLLLQLGIGVRTAILGAQYLMKRKDKY